GAVAVGGEQYPPGADYIERALRQFAKEFQRLGLSGLENDALVCLDSLSRLRAIEAAAAKAPNALYLYAHWLKREGDDKGAESIRAIEAESRQALSARAGEEAGRG